MNKLTPVFERQHPSTRYVQNEFEFEKEVILHTHVCITEPISVKECVLQCRRHSFTLNLSYKPFILQLILRFFLYLLDVTINIKTFFFYVEVSEVSFLSYFFFS